MKKFTFELINGGRYSTNATDAKEAKLAILKDHPWIRPWDLVLVHTC